MNASSLPLDALFSLVNGAALIGWIALVALPRTQWLQRVLMAVPVLALCMVYAALVFVYFFGVQGGGFSTLDEVQALFTSREVALAGWVHYLAFDLFVGLWIARRGDEIGVSRWMQAPLLLTTFLFGPIGLLMASALFVAQRRPAAATPA